MKRIRWSIEYLLLVNLIAFIQVLPVAACEHLARLIGWLAVDLLGVRQKTIDQNLVAIFPQMTAEQRLELSRGMWRHLFLMVCEIGYVHRKIHETNWRKHIQIRSEDQIIRYLLDNRPIVIVSGHFGNFEVGATTLGILGFPSYAVARVMDNPWIERLIRRFREAKGQFIFPKDGIANLVQQVLSAGKTLSLLGDQHAGTKGVWVDFLGRPAACHKALALFTLVNQAPMMVLYCRRTDAALQFEIDVLGVADPAEELGELRDVATLTQWYNDCLGRIIFQHPEQYWWLHRRWKDKPVRKTKKHRTAA